MKYKNSDGEYLNIYIRQENLNDYWLFINSFSYDTNNQSNYHLEVEYQAFVKNNNIRNSRIIIREGKNQIYAFLHQAGTSQELNDKSFLEFGMQSYLHDDVRKRNFVNKQFLNKEDVNNELQIMVNNTEVETNTIALSNLLLPNLVDLNNIKINEQNFLNYKKILDSIMYPLRKKVNQKKYHIKL